MQAPSSRTLPPDTPRTDQDAAAAKVRLTRRSAAYWRVTFDNPPLNIVGPPEVRRLQQIVGEIEADPKVKVVVFDSAVPDHFMAHYDLLAPLSDSANMAPGPTGMHPVPDFMARLSRLKPVTIVSIRGRASGIGSEIALAADMRFASREKAFISQFEVGAGFSPGGGPMARLPRLVGRGRALEILLAADEINGELAERYGYVNRARCRTGSSTASSTPSPRASPPSTNRPSSTPSDWQIGRACRLTKRCRRGGTRSSRPSGALALRRA